MTPQAKGMQRVREAIGPDIKSMCDINQRWRVEQTEKEPAHQRAALA